MPTAKASRTLTIFLVKPGLIEASDIIAIEDCDAPLTVPISGAGTGLLFIKQNAPKPPKWCAIFEPHINLRKLKANGISAAFLLETASSYYVLTFGQGGRFLIRSNVCEERFGLICALNALDPNSIRCVDVQSLDAIDSHTRIQSSHETTSDQFGIDVEQDMLKAVVGVPKNPQHGTRMQGAEALAVSVAINLSDLPVLLRDYKKQFDATLSADNYEWVNNISIVKDMALIATLEASLDARLSAEDFSDVWLSIPDIIEWTLVRGFMYEGGKKVIYPDINLEGFLNTLKPGTSVSLSLMRSRHIHCADSDHKSVFRSWSVFKCLYAEVCLGSARFILNDGKWFTVASDFVSKTDAAFAKIPICSLILPSYVGNGEAAYNAAVANQFPDQFLLLDAKNISHGGGHGRVEVCDLLTTRGQLIHVKLYGKSSVFSHLFSQGLISGQLIQTDGEFRKKVRKAVSAPYAPLFDPDRQPPRDSLTVVFAVISDQVTPTLRLPFFSRVNANNVVKILKGYGYKVEILKVNVDPLHSKKTIAPTKEPKKGANRTKAVLSA